MTKSAIQRDPLQIDETHPPAMIELNFDSYGERLNGILYQANGVGPHPTVVLLHGYPGNEKNLDLAQTMRRAGYNVLFFHYRGAWGSYGDFSFTHVIEDVGSAIQYLRESAKDIRVDPDKILLVGHSMGGFAALQGAANDGQVKCVAGIAPADLGLAADLIGANPEMGKGFAAGADRLTMLNGWSGDIVLDELENNRDEFSLTDLAPKLIGKNVLLIAGDKDTAVAPDVFHTPLVKAYQAQPEIELNHQIIPGDHAFSYSRFLLIETVLDWALACEGTN
ncbi:MAG: alpha/beta fold hydrolase [Proteobacteria bacterium]|nr:alpha/beta fold hydrolase [Pseudomonadota bacterium]